MIKDVSERPQEVPDYHPKHIADLEKKVSELAETTVQAYNTALFAMKKYNSDVCRLIENSIGNRDPSIWTSLQSNTQRKAETLKSAEQNAEDTAASIRTLRELVNSPDCKAPSNIKLQASDLKFVKISWVVE